MPPVIFFEEKREFFRCESLRFTRRSRRINDNGVTGDAVFREANWRRDSRTSRSSAAGIADSGVKSSRIGEESKYLFHCVKPQGAASKSR